MQTRQMPINTELEHKYGPNYHILDNPFFNTRLARACESTCVQPEFNSIISDLYRSLIEYVLVREFPCVEARVRTRMADMPGYEKPGHWSGTIIDKETQAVVVNIIRAGTLPSMLAFEILSQALEPANVRVDHVVMARIADADGHVTGAHFGESKIGGDIDNSIVILPDPMAATGSSISKALEHYKSSVPGKAVKFISLNLIVTPDFIKRMKADHPEMIVYGLRLDRAASSERALAAMPGTYIEEESGLTDIQYIIPGGGGFGELMNNSYC